MQNRRQFITTTGAGIVAVGVAGQIVPAEAAVAEKGRIVQIETAEMLKRGRPIPEVTQSMLDKGMLEFTGKKKQADAWASLFSASEKIGIKINCLGKPKMSTTPEVVNAIIAGLKAAGVPEKNEPVAGFAVRRSAPENDDEARLLERVAGGAGGLR